jgi:hypothetical protein
LLSVEQLPGESDYVAPMKRRVSRRSLVKGIGGVTAVVSAGAIELVPSTSEASTPGSATLRSGLDDGQSARESTSVVESAGAARTVNWSPSNPWADLTLDAPVCHLTLPAPTGGAAAELQLILRQDAIGGRKVRWPENVRSIGAIPALTTIRGAFDQFTLYSEDGATWTLEGTTGGPSGSIDPLALAHPVLVIEARAQPLPAGATIASTGGTIASLLDRSPADHALVAQNPVPGTFNPHAGPGSPWYGPLQPGEIGYPRVDLAPGGALAVSGLKAMDDYLLYYLLWFHSRQSPKDGFNYVSLNDGPKTMVVASGNADNCWKDGTSYHNYTSAPGDTPDYSTIPLLGMIAVGADSPKGPDAVYHRLNGAVQTFDRTPPAPKGLTGMTIGAAVGLATAPTELDVLAAGIISPCPPLADLRRLEQWVAGLGGLRLRSS